MKGFIVHAFHQPSHGHTWICLVGRGIDGSTFAVVETRELPFFYVRISDMERARPLAEKSGSRINDSSDRTMDGEECVKMCSKTLKGLDRLRYLLEAEGIRTYEADLRFFDEFLIDKKIHGTIEIRGEWKPGRHVDRIFIDPEIFPGSEIPALTVLSIDIETNVDTGQILSIGICERGTDGKQGISEVILNCAGTTLTKTESPPWIVCERDEPSVLIRFSNKVNEIDPDIITGWNVLDFDLKTILERFEHFQIPADFGRSEKAVEYLSSEGRIRSAVIIPGRQALDGFRLVRSGPLTFEDFRLQTVAETVLGAGKVDLQEDEESKVEAIVRSYHEDTEAFCRYCRQDTELVLDILDETGMMELTVLRSELIGVALSRAWTSIAAFDRLYIEAMHEQGLVAPTLGIDALPMASAPGGTIIPPQAGYYTNVFIFDFRSLYPTIMQTFNIDPYSYAEANYRLEGDSEELIQAPNGAVFSRNPGLLPKILEQFFTSRADAKERGDETASYVYKIVMNSFYGVLGANGCRFASSDLAGAVTSYAQEILHWCQRWFTDKGYNVLYGDTDSLFVLSGLSADTETGQLDNVGDNLAVEINRGVARYIQERWDLTSLLDLEFEKVYSDLFLPPARFSYGSCGQRGGQRGAEVVGRAKGYAGLVQSGDLPKKDRVLEIKGMEAVRRDWTELATQFQIRLLRLLFERGNPEIISDYIRETISKVKKGEYDNLLIYRKALRKPLSSYTSNVPPHVQAAKLLPGSMQSGTIRYVWTVDGPQPASRRSSKPDYGHYIAKQLKPIAETISFAVDIDTDAIFDEDRQTNLF